MKAKGKTPVKNGIETTKQTAFHHIDECMYNVKTSDYFGVGARPKVSNKETDSEKGDLSALEDHKSVSESDKRDGRLHLVARGSRMVAAKKSY